MSSDQFVGANLFIGSIIVYSMASAVHTNSSDDIILPGKKNLLKEFATAFWRSTLSFAIRGLTKNSDLRRVAPTFEEPIKLKESNRPPTPTFEEPIKLKESNPPPTQNEGQCLRPNDSAWDSHSWRLFLSESHAEAAKCEFKLINDLGFSVIICWIDFNGGLHHFYRVNDKSIADGSVKNVHIEHSRAHHAFICLLSSDILPKTLAEVPAEVSNAESASVFMITVFLGSYISLQATRREHTPHSSNPPST
jgi:hypothetical protein